MRHLYNEDYSDLESASSSMKIKEQESRLHNQDEKDKKSDAIDPNDKGVNTTSINTECKEEIEQTNVPEDVIQSFSTISGIALPMATRFV